AFPICPAWAVSPRPRATQEDPRMARYSSSRVRSRSSAPLRTVSSATPDLLDERRDVLRLRRLAVAVVDGHDRGIAAAAGALDQPKGDLAVVGGFSGRDPELLFERVDDLLRADEGAGEVRADLDDVTADRLEVVHVVERRDRLDLRRSEVHRVGHLSESFRREPSSMVFLREPKSVHHGRARTRVPRLQAVNFPLKVRSIFGGSQRSTSPITVSSEPTIAIRSATSAWRMHVAVASSAANDGARNLTRQGLGPPPEAT